MYWFLKVFKKSLDFNGRARRKEFWIFVLFNFIFTTILGEIEKSIGSGAILGTLYYVIIFIPALTLNIRRLHDTARSGKNLFTPYILFIILIIFFNLKKIDAENISSNIEILVIFLLIGFVLFISSIWTLILFAKKGNIGENKYGEDPKKMEYK